MLTNERCCRVIVSCFIHGRSGRNNSPPSPETTLSFLKKIINSEMEKQSRIPYDIIVINHDTGFKAGNEYIQTINDTNTRNGKIYAITTPNYGLSFDGYNTAFIKYADKYDYWIFSEDDHLLTASDYYSILLEEYKSYKDKIGFLALAPISTTYSITHSGGGFGMTTTEVLKKIYLLRDSLPCLSAGLNRTDSEIYFTHNVITVGYEIIENNSFYLYPQNYEMCKDHMIHIQHINKRYKNNNKEYLFQVGRLQNEEW